MPESKQWHAIVTYKLKPLCDVAWLASEVIAI
jgi:hypothetical protein